MQIVNAKSLEGDMIVIRLVLDRIMPIRRERPVFFELPLLKTAYDAVKVVGSILAVFILSKVISSNAWHRCINIMRGFADSW
jgi:hypothetical protein